MVISVSLHHQHYNFRKIQQEHVKWTGAIVYMRRFTLSFPPWLPCKGAYYTSQRAMSTVDVTHSENHQKHLSKSNCWMLDHWMLGGPVAGVTPLAYPGNLPHPQMCCHLRPLYLHFHCPKPVQKFGLGTGTCVS